MGEGGENDGSQDDGHYDDDGDGNEDVVDRKIANAGKERNRTMVLVGAHDTILILRNPKIVLVILFRGTQFTVKKALNLKLKPSKSPSSRNSAHCPPASRPRSGRETASLPKWFAVRPLGQPSESLCNRFN